MRLPRTAAPAAYLAALLSLSAGPATAQDIPRYPVERYCQEVANVSGGSRMIYNGCIDMEQDAYDRLRRSWANLPAQARRYCDEVARVTGGSYTILKGCIDMETEAGASTPGFRY